MRCSAAGSARWGRFRTGSAVWAAVFGVLILVLGASLFVARPWCRWLCPFGAVQGLIQLIAPWKMRRDSATCTDCGTCSQVCPMSVDIAHQNAVRDTRCNRCGECLSACPVEGALEHRPPTVGNGRLALRSRVLTGVLTIALFAAPIATARQMSLFKTRGGPLVARGKLTTADIRGSMTVGEVARGLDLGMDELRELLDLPPSVGRNTALRDLRDWGITPRAFRDLASLKQGIPDSRTSGSGNGLGRRPDN